MIVLRKGRDAFDMYDFYMAEATKANIVVSGRTIECALSRLRESIRRVNRKRKMRE